MTERRSWMKGLCLAALVLAMLSAFAHAEGTEMKDVPLTLQASYKKDGENNPLYTQRFGADPGVMEYDGRLYVYMTDDTIERDASGQVKENSYQSIKTLNCISSDDLVNWTDHGQIRVAGINGAAKWAHNSWAPCAAHKTFDGQEKFFLYFCDGGNGIGVLTADSPTGPWRDELGKLLISRAVPNCSSVVWLFDPAVFVDDDGTGYLAFGGGIPNGKQKNPGTARIVRLGADMISLDMDPIRIDVPWFFEDSGLNKIGDRYIYSYCSNWQTDGNTLRLTSGAIEYMTAESPLGPYTYAGELFPNQGRFFGLYGNNHHSIVSFNDVWYLFYHNRSVEKAMGITGNYRSPQMNRIDFYPNGNPKTVKGTMKGEAQLKPLDPYSPVSARTMANQAGITVKNNHGTLCAQGDSGSWIKVAGVDFGSGTQTIKVTAIAPTECTLYAVLDDPKGPIAAQLSLEVPADAEETEFAAPFHAEGIHNVYLIIDGEVSLTTWHVE